MFCNPLVQKYGGVNLHRNMLKIFTQELRIWGGNKNKKNKKNYEFAEVFRSDLKA